MRRYNVMYLKKLLPLENVEFPSNWLLTSKDTYVCTLIRFQTSMSSIEISLNLLLFRTYNYKYLVVLLDNPK